MKRLLLFLFLLPGTIAYSQGQHTLRGRVVSATDSQPLPGATIRLKGLPAGTSTDAQGNFELQATAGKVTLVASFVGFESRELALDLPLAGPLLISLQEGGAALQEVVVSTGYQQLPRERATGAFTQVDNGKLNEQVGPDIVSRLEAVTNSLTMDRTTTGGRLMVRGLSTIRGPKDPLIILDNFPYDGDITHINPNDVESVTVLKDAAAASIWGTRAGNGVIVITTKKGKLSQPLSVEFNANITRTAKPDLAYARPISSSDFIDVEQLLYSKGYYNFQVGSVARTPLSPVVELLLQRDNGTLSPAAAEAQLNALRHLDVRDEYARHFYQAGLHRQYALNLRGGSDKTSWLFSSGYDHNLDQLDARYNRLTLRFEQTYRPLPRLNLSAGVMLTKKDTESGRPGYGDISSRGPGLFPYARFADEAGSPLPLTKDYRSGYVETAGNGHLLDWRYYPLEDYRHVRNTTDAQDLVASFGAKYELLKGLSADLKYRFQHQLTTGRGLQGADSYGARNLVNLYTRLDPATGQPLYRIPRGGILDLSHTQVQSHNLRGQLGYDRRLENHAIAAIAGGEVRAIDTDSDANRYYGFHEDILTSGNVDHTVPYPTFVTGSTAFIPGGASFIGQRNRFVSAFSNAAYTYRGRYTVSGSARRDASNLFGLRTNEKWNPLWSSGIAWNLSEESFYKAGLLPFLKLRATYGFSGNVDPAMTAVTTLMYQLPSPYTLLPIARFDRYGDTGLRWETSRMINFGMDFGFRGDAVTGSLEYFRKRGTDLFGTAPVDNTAGVGHTVIRNTASMKGEGVDLELQTLNLDRGIRWTSHFNFSFYRDEVTDYYLASEQGSNFVSSDLRISGLVGRPVYAIFSYPWAGLDPQTGDPQGFLEGEISKNYTSITGAGTTAGDLRYHGSALPRLFGSLGNTLSWKNFSVNVRVLYKLGYYFRRSSIVYTDLFANWNGHADYARRWQQPGDEAHTDVPSLVYPNTTTRDSFYRGSEVLVERGDHVRLQYVNLAYTLPGETWKRAPFKSLQLYLNLAGPGLLWRANKVGLDPEFRGQSYGNALPVPPAYSLGLRASF